MEIILFIVIALLAIQIIILIRMYDKDTTELNEIIINLEHENTRLEFRNNFLCEALDIAMQVNKEPKTTKRKKAK